MDFVYLGCNSEQKATPIKKNSQKFKNDDTNLFEKKIHCLNQQLMQIFIIIITNPKNMKQQTTQNNTSDSNITENNSLPNQSQKILQKQVYLSSRWNTQQSLKYLIFVQNKISILSNRELRKTKKIFLQLSNLIKTRSPDQCRSHHQKMIKLYKTQEGIIAQLQSKHFEKQSTISKDQMDAQVASSKVQDGYQTLTSFNKTDEQSMLIDEQTCNESDNCPDDQANSQSSSYVLQTQEEQANAQEEQSVEKWDINYVFTF